MIYFLYHVYGSGSVDRLNYETGYLDGLMLMALFIVIGEVSEMVL